MATRRQLSTKDYPDDARHRLAEAVAQARSAAGYRSRPAFARGRTDFKLRSLEKVESAIPGVGQEVLYAIARALRDQGWTEDTPRLILEGGQAPTPRKRRPEQPPLTAQQKALLAVYRNEYLPKYGREEAQRLLAQDVDAINAAIEREERSAG